MSYLLVILALVLLVVVHELGHFLVARRVGVRATKFYVFFPPALLKRQIGDVEYGLGAIPAGGFVKLPGMFEPVVGEVAERVRWECERLVDDLREAAGERATDDAVVDGLAELEDSVARIAGASGPDDLPALLERVDGALVGLVSGPALASVSAADRAGLVKRIRRARGRVVETIDDCHPNAYWRAALWRRMSVILAGPAVNVVVAFVALAGFYWLYLPTYEIAGPLKVESVQEGGPAENAGLDAESRITWWNGPIEGEEPGSVYERIADSLGEPIELKWTNGEGKRFERTIEPERIDGEKRIGVGLPPVTSKKALAYRVSGHERTSPGFGARAALEDMRSITWGNLSRLPRIFFDREVREDVSSVVGIVQVADEVDRAGQFWRYIGVISLVLAVMNLLPLLPLDGGHLFFGLLEYLRRGRPMPRASFERFSAVGFGLVLMLFFIGLNNDLTR